MLTASVDALGGRADGDVDRGLVAQACFLEGYQETVVRPGGRHRNEVRVAGERRRSGAECQRQDGSSRDDRTTHMNPPEKDSCISEQITRVIASRSGGDRDRALVGACPMMRAPIRRMTPPSMTDQLGPNPSTGRLAGHAIASD